MSTMLVGPRRVGKTTVCDAVCDRLRRDHGFLVMRIEVPERPDSRELLQLILDRCARISLADEGRAALKALAPAIEKLLGVDLDLGGLGSEDELPLRAIVG